MHLSDTAVLIFGDTTLRKSRKMKNIFEKEIIRIAMCISLSCLTVTSTLQGDFLIPKWMRHFNDENSTDIPKMVLQLEAKMLYPTSLIARKLFKFQDQLKISQRLHKTQRPIPKSTDFFCDTNGTRSLTKPSSAHKLRPGDIDVIGSIGDSLTVGIGSFAITIPQLLVENRGTSWSTGGQGTWREFLTLANILKVFNPKLIGYAYGDSSARERFSQFNVAEAGALSKDLPYMTRELVKRIKMDKRINVNEDWKLITILMGSNTFCLEMCYENYKKYPELHKKEYLDALLYIKENLPRTIVNVILSPNLVLLKKFTNLPPVCYITRIIECPCLFAKQYEHRLRDFIKVMEDFQKVEKEIVEYEELKNKDDFTVVLQTFTENVIFPLNRFNTTDVSYLAADCFHLSQKGYARLSLSVWNNMMEPVGRKSTNSFNEFDRFLCPTNESPFIRTWKNSLL